VATWSQIRVKAGKMTLDELETPLWLQLNALIASELDLREVDYLLWFRPVGNILPVIQAAKPQRALVAGERLKLLYPSLREAEEAVKRLRRAGVLVKTANNLHGRILDHIAKLLKNKKVNMEFLRGLDLTPEDRARVIARALLGEA